MSTAPSTNTPYRVLVPVSDNEASAQAQALFVASLPNAPTTVTATLTHVLHGGELNTSRQSRSAQRIGTVVHVRDYLDTHGVSVQIMDVDEPFPPTKGIVALANKLDADLIVLGGGMHSLLDDLLTGNVSKSVGRHTNRPITVVSKTYTTATSEE
ncbi:universal stress protein [Haloferax sp. YSMS24]|uniref:universal stress protein n=1 Tax=unclassified Haloferax TaxID=2625095 RepID=UPI00398D11F1